MQADLEGAQLARACRGRDLVRRDHAAGAELVEEAGAREPLREAAAPRAAPLDAAELLLRADALLGRDLQREGAAAGRQHSAQGLERELLLRGARGDEEDAAVLAQRGGQEREQRGRGLAHAGRRAAQEHETGCRGARHLAQHRLLHGARLGKRKARLERAARTDPAELHLGAPRDLLDPLREKAAPGLATEGDRAPCGLDPRRQGDHGGARHRLAAELEQKRREARALERARGAVLGVVVGNGAQHLERRPVRACLHGVRTPADLHRPVPEAELRLEAQRDARAAALGALQIRRAQIRERTQLVVRRVGPRREPHRADVDEVVDADREGVRELVRRDHPF